MDKDSLLFVFLGLLTVYVLSWLMFQNVKPVDCVVVDNKTLCFFRGNNE